MLFLVSSSIYSQNHSNVVQHLSFVDFFWPRFWLFGQISGRCAQMMWPVSSGISSLRCRQDSASTSSALQAKGERWGLRLQMRSFRQMPRASFRRCLWSCCRLGYTSGLWRRSCQKRSWSLIFSKNLLGKDSHKPCPSRVTEVSREGRTYKDKEEPIGTTPDRAWSLGSLCPWHFSILDILFDAAIFLADISFSWQWHPCLMMPLSLHLVCACHLWILTAPLLLTAQELGTWHTLLSWQISFLTLFILYSFHCCFPAVSYSLQFPTPFTFPTLQLSTSHYIFIVFTSLLSWHLYSLHLYSLHISTLFTSFLLHISTLYPPLQSSHLYRPCNGVQASYCRASHTGQAIRVMYSSVSVGVVHVLGTCTQV